MAGIEQQAAEAAAARDDAAGAPATDISTPALPEPPSQPEAPLGLYLWGGVGTGKSMLMDSFYASAPTENKRRVHFHQFLIEVHERLHTWQQERIKTHGRSGSLSHDLANDSVYQVGLGLAEEVDLLCFDEFQVADVADALILRRLFSALFERGVVVVATSNRVPTLLYEQGINREYFLPFIPLLESRCAVHAMESETDHRQLGTAIELGEDDQVFFVDGADSRERFEALWDRSLSSAGQTEPQPRVVQIRQGREIHVVEAAGGACRFHFDELCSADVGAADFGALANAFHTIVIDGLPKLTTDSHNEAQRFVTLVDELYESRCRVAFWSDVPLSSVFEQGRTVKMTTDGAAATPFNVRKSNKGRDAKAVGRDELIDGTPSVAALRGQHSPVAHKDALLEDLQALAHNTAFEKTANDPAAEDLAVSAAEFAAIHELQLAFARAASRMVEMGTAEYLGAHAASVEAGKWS